jgi:hypothetical protein
VERRAELVRHARHEVALRLTRLLGAAPYQFGVAPRPEQVAPEQLRPAERLLSS